MVIPSPAIKTAKEVIGDYGESGCGVHCPYCFGKQFPQTDHIATCLTCGNPYQVPIGYMPRRKVKEE